MANTIGYGQGAVNNTNGFGKAPTNNTIDFGEVCADSWSPETNLVGGSSFSNTQSIELDGIDAHVTMGNVLNFDITDAFTFSCWIKFDTLGTDEVFISKWSSASSFKGYALYKNSSDKLVVFLRESSSRFNLFVSTATVSNNVWYNIVVTYDGSRLNSGINLYLNSAVQAGTRSGLFSSGSMTTTLPFNVGARNNGELPVNGFMDEVAVWDSELSSTDVNTIYGTGTPSDLTDLSPLSWWRFEETSGTTATDSGSGGNTGTLDNTVVRSTDVPT